MKDVKLCDNRFKVVFAPLLKSVSIELRDVSMAADVVA
jgi:hypothetical protein